MLRNYYQRIFVLLFLLLTVQPRVHAQQFLTDMVDTTTEIGRGLFSVYQQYDRLRFGCYIQPQFQWTSGKGSRNYSGGDFAPESNNRFMLRRGRFRLDYVRRNKEQLPVAQFAFQLDGTERGVNIRDLWGRVFENKFHLFSLTMGMYGRPFGYELILSSSERESPERGRMSQILMRTERDLGAMLSIEPRDPKSKFQWVRFDIGAFNGQGLTGPGEYDSHKDIITRIHASPQRINRLGWKLSGGFSAFIGGLTSQSNIYYKIDGKGEDATLLKDSSGKNFLKVLPRDYYSADAQLRIPNRRGFTELRAEYWTGGQTGTLASSETPGTYPQVNNQPGPLTTRKFNGAFFYLLQNLGHERHQLVLKYDWYDPNIKVKGQEVTSAHGFTTADIKYQTFGAGYVWYLNPNFKATLWYDHIRNESTAINGFTKDADDDVLTCRLQYRF